MSLANLFIKCGKLTNIPAKLLVDKTADDGEEMKAGEIGSVLIVYDNGTYHFEHNTFTCIVTAKEIKFLNGGY